MLSDGNVEPLVLEPHVLEHELSVVASSDVKGYTGHAGAFWTYWRKTRAPLAALFGWRVAAPELPGAFERAACEPPVKIFVS